MVGQDTVALGYQFDQGGYAPLEVGMEFARPLQDRARLADLSIESDHGPQRVGMD